MLMDTLISCKSIGMSEVLLDVISVSSAAISFYKSYGFVEESRRRFDDYDIITMKLTLSSFLSPEQIESFKRDGYLVVPGILSAKEVSEAQDGMWATLAEHGVEKERLHETAHNLHALSSTHGAGGVLDIFYSQLKHTKENQKYKQAISEIFEATYANPRKGELWQHPHGPFSSVFFQYDRLGFRLPDGVKARLEGNVSKEA